MYATPFKKTGDVSEMKLAPAVEMLPAEWICHEVARLRVANEMLSERLDLVESGNHIAGYAALKGIVADLQAELADLKERGLQGGDANPDGEEKKYGEDGDINWDELNAMDVEHEKYQLNPNTWEIPLFIGVHVLKPSVSFMLLLGLALTLATQFTLIGAITFFGSEFEEDTVEQLERWRATEGQSLAFAHPLTKTSLSSRVCAGDESLSVGIAQLDLYKNLDKFGTTFMGMPCGPTLAIAVLTVWSLYIVVEVNDIREFLISLRGTKRGPTTIASNGPESLHLKCISLARVTGMTFVCLLRFTVTAALFFWGSLWQIKTRDMENLVLNASALAFVVADVPTLIYDVIVPMKAKVLLESMEPLKRSPRKRVHGFEILMILDITAVTVVVCICATYLYHFQGIQTKAMEVMCDGELDFIWAQDSFGRLLVAETYPVDALVTDIFPFEVDYITSIANYSLPIGVLDAQNIVSASVRDRSAFPRNLGTICEDHDVGGLWVIYSNRRLSCFEARNYCMTNAYVRLQCPVTCGCDDPYSGMPLVSTNFGCPREACVSTPKFKAYSDTAPCEDLTANYLSSNSSWLMLIDRLFDFIETGLQPVGESPSRNSVRSDLLPRLTDLRDEGREQGCGILDDFNFKKLIHETFTLREFANVCDGLVGYCPLSCQCHVHLIDGCPASCSSVSRRLSPRSNHTSKE